jgi:uncharacterized repeat protein (TIGR03803 family)
MAARFWAIEGGLFMKGKGLCIGFRATLAILAVLLFTARTWASDERVLHHFNGDGAQTNSNLIWDVAGNLYGTAPCDGLLGNGSCPDYYGLVFELTPTGGGSWSEEVLFTFGGGGAEYQPQAGLIFDAAGNLYGTTRCEFNGQGFCGDGAVFELMPGEGGTWTQKALHYFGGRGGSQPTTSLIWDAAGNLYGTTTGGGDYGYPGGGTVFELTPDGSGNWTEKVLHSFGYHKDGQYPAASLIWDASGNLYGITSYGGSLNKGTAFELSPNEDGSWTEKVLHNFGNGMDGQTPLANLVWDAAGNLYGTTYQGGDYGFGTVFEMTPKQGGGWTEKTLHNFGLHGTDGRNSRASLVWDAAGNLYGTASTGGVYGFGTVFEMLPRQGGGWTEKTVHNFGLYGTDGQNPGGSLVWDAAGNLYGTTASGGRYWQGTVFEITP